MDRTEESESLDDRTGRDSGNAISGQSSDAPQERVSTVQELLGQDLARLAELIPEETRYHLKRAGSEAGLALYHLWRRVEAQARGPAKPKVRKHIDVRGPEGDESQ